MPPSSRGYKHKAWLSTLGVSFLLHASLCQGFRLTIPIGQQKRQHSSRSASNKMVLAHEADVYLPVDPANTDSRKVPFSQIEVNELHEFAEEIRDLSKTLSIVVLPCWRNHVVQYDALSAALEKVGLKTTVKMLRDGLWARVLKLLSVRELGGAQKQSLQDLQVVMAMEPMFHHLQRVLAEAYTTTGKPLVVLASNDAAWAVRAFLNSRPSEWVEQCPVLAVVLLGTHRESLAGQAVLNTYKAPLAEEIAAAVSFYSLDISPPQLGGHTGSGQEQAHLTCVTLDDIEECLIRNYGGKEQEGLAKLSDSSMLRVWVSKVLGGLP